MVMAVGRPTVGVISICFESETLPQKPPLVVSVKVTGEVDDKEAVYVVVPGVDPKLFVKEPPAPPSDQTADVAPPPNEPPKAAEVPP